MQTHYNITQILAQKQEASVKSLHITYEGDTPIEELTKFTHLKKLEIILQKPLPTESILGQLSTLETLIIYGNICDMQSICNLVYLRELSILNAPNLKAPVAIGAWTRLEQLTIKNTSIQALPSEIGLLTKLTYLDLSNNSLLNNLPEAVYNLQFLHTLSIDNCPIDVLSEKISQLTALQRLNIAHTRIAELPEALVNLPALVLSYHETPAHYKIGGNANFYHEFIKYIVSKTTDLEKRKLYFNFFCGYIGRIKAQNKIELVHDALVFSHKVVRAAAMSYWYRQEPSPFPPTSKMVLHLTPPQAFQLDWEVITPLLSAENIEIATKLDSQVTHLIIGSRPTKASVGKAHKLCIPIISYGHFRDYLRELDNSMYLHHEDADTLIMAENLRKLLRSEDTQNVALGLQMAIGGGLNSVYFYDVLLLYIWEFDAETRKLAMEVLEKYLPIDAFLHLTSHHQYRIYSVDEAKIADYLRIITQHQAFDADKLAIAFFEKFATGFHFCLANPISFLWYCQQKRQNSVLKLNGLQINHLPDNVGELKGIKILYLHQNALRFLPATFALLTQIDTLNLDKNELTQFPAVLTDMPRLASLSLANNQLTNLPANIDKMQALQTLNLYNNQITDLPEAIFNLPALRSLNIGGGNPVAKKMKVLQAKMPYCQIMAVK